MAKRTVTHLIDDIDDTEIAEGKGGTLTFALAGTEYEIDLSDRNRQALEKALRPYIDAARPRPRGRGRQPARGSRLSDASLVRDWARARGIAVPDRGRIPADVREAYEQR